jgi:hypothetical protein
MEPLKGIQNSKIPYEQLEFVGVLLFAEYPSTTVYKDADNNPVLKEWVDCNADNTIDRFYYYSVEPFILKQFLEKDISHYDLIKGAKEGYVFFQDEKKGEVSVPILVSFKSIPYDYLPARDFMFSENDGVDIEMITKFFDLKNVNKPIVNIPEVVRKLSNREKAETLYIHLEKGNNVGYGTIKTEVFGSTLISIDRLYKNNALDYLKTTNRTDIQLDAEKNKEYLPYTETEVFGVAVRASFGFMIRPIVSNIDLFENTPAYQIAERTFNLINNSKSKDSLSIEYTKHSIYTIKKYEEFLAEIYKNQINIDLNWFNPLTKKELSAGIRYVEANAIIEDIKQIFISTEVDIELIGKFRAIDCDTAHFVFISTDKQKYSGYFNRKIKESLNEITFMDVYKIIIHRTLKKEPGKYARNEDIITTCYLDT